jgi:hypothetical protein
MPQSPRLRPNGIYAGLHAAGGILTELGQSTGWVHPAISGSTSRISLRIALTP